MLEWIAVALGVACVALTVRQHVACWPVGLAMVAVYLVVFARARLYADMVLQGVYVVLQIYGWHAWLRGGPERGTLRVSRLPAAHVVPWVLAGVAGTAALGGAMARWTDAAMPFIDAGTTVASLIAQWLMGRKVLESWLVWIAVDAASIGMYRARGLHATAWLYGLFLILAALGYRSWRRSWIASTATSAAGATA